MNPEVRVVIVDDHPLFREGLRSVLARHSDIAVVGEADEGEQAVALLKDRPVDLLVTDVDMPRMNGLELAATVRKLGLVLEVIVLTMYREEDMFNEAMDAGVRGYVLKENAVQDIVAAIRTVADGRYYISPSISEYLVTRGARAKALLEERPSLATLTPTERRVLRLIAEEQSSRQIAELLHVSAKTVENHRTNISSKLHLRGSHSLLKFAISHRREL